MDQYFQDFDPSRLFDSSFDRDFEPHETPQLLDWTSCRERDTAIDLGVIPQTISNVTFPKAPWCIGADLGAILPTISDVTPLEAPWYFGAEYAVAKESDAPSGLQDSSRAWPGYIPSHPSISVSLDFSTPSTEPLGENATSDGGHDLDSSNTSGRSGRQSTTVTPTSSRENPMYATKQSPDLEHSNSNDASSRKRPFVELVMRLPSTQNVQIARTKKPYSPPRREEVALHRDVRSCSRCRFRRVPFTFPKPCEKCIEVAGGPKLARWICVRDSFRDLRFGGFGEMYPRHAASYKCVLSNIDLLFESSTQDFLKSEIQTYRGLERKIHLALRFDSEAPTAFSLPITVRDYSNQDSKKEALYHTMAIDRTHFKNVPSDRYAIIPGGVPSLNDLLNCFRADVASVGGHSVERLITALNEFMDQYCGNEPQLPLVSLKPSPRVLITIYLVRLAEKLSKNLKAIALLAEYKNGFTDADKTYSALASKAVSSQILLVIKEGIRKEELLVLKYLEKLMYGAKGPGEENMIPLWACLWSLILTYRDCMNVYNQYSLAPRSNYKQPGCSDHEMGAGASKQMYDKLTVNYSALFRTMTPLYFDLQDEDNSIFIGKSTFLKEAFTTLQTQVLGFYKASDEFGTEDLLLREFIIDQEKGQRPGHPLKL